MSSSLPRSTPAVQRVDPAAILSFLDAVDKRPGIEMHSLMVVRHGLVVAEGWWAPYSAGRPQLLYSLSKSFTSTAAAFAQAEGLLNLDDTVISHFAEFAADITDPRSRSVKVRHVASMATGHTRDMLGEAIMRDLEEPVRGFLLMPPDRDPGTVFAYSQPCTYALASIIQRNAGMPLTQYLRPRLFDPLGIGHVGWHTFPPGREQGFSGLHARTEDVAKLGLLYLQRGRWEGAQLIPERWVAEATSKQISNLGEPNPDWRQGYGFQFWMSRHGYRGDGAFGQFCVILPEQETVIVTTPCEPRSSSWKRRTGGTSPAPCPAAARRPCGAIHRSPPASSSTCTAPVKARTLLLVVAVLGGRQVESGIAIEEAVGPELEPDRGDRHHRPVLRTDHVVRGERVPQHEVCVLQRAVGGGPRGQPVPAGVLVGVVAGREALVGVVRGDPQVFGGELGPPDHVAVGLVERQHTVLGHELVGHRITQTVRPIRVGDPPVASDPSVGQPLRLRLPDQRGLPYHPRVAVRVVRAGRQRHRVAFDHRVAWTVHHHVQPYAEDVLVVRPVDLRRNQRAMGRALPRRQRPVGDHAGQLDLVLDRAVLVEVPEVAVLVVADGGDHRDDQPPGAPDLGFPGPPVHVLPADPVVFLVQADGVRQDLGVAVVVVQPGVEVADLAQAVTAKLQAVGQHPDAVFAHIEDVLAALRGVRVAVGDEHLRQRGAVEDRPERATVLVPEQVQDQPFARGEADPESPLLPAHLVPVHGEAGAFRLGDAEWFHVLAGAVGEVRDVGGVADRLGRVVAAGRRQRDHAVVLDVHDLHPVQVEPDNQAFHRAGVPVVVGIPLPHPGQGPEEPALVRPVLGAVVADRPGVDHHHVEVGDAAPAHGFLPAGIFPDRLFGGQELLEHDGRLDAGEFGPQLSVAGGKGDDGLVGFAFGSFAQDDVGLAVYRLAFSVAEDGVLGGFAQRDVDEARAVGEVAVALEDAGGGLDLGAGQRVERVAHLGIFGRGAGRGSRRRGVLGRGHR